MDIKLVDPSEYLMSFSLCLVLLSDLVQFGSLDPDVLPRLTFSTNIKQNKINVKQIFSVYLTYIIIGLYFKNTHKNG